jgi:hypothetical protein
MPAAPARRPRPTRAYGLARRLAQGAPVAAVARAARCAPSLLEQLLADPEFQELLAGWQDLLRLAPDARTRRLVVLAHGVLEQALAEGRLGAALFTLVEASAGRDPVVSLAQGIERALARAPLPAAADPLAADRPPAARAAPPRDRLQTATRHAAAALRATIVQEHGQSLAPLPAAPAPDGADPLGAAVHALHRMADAAAQRQHAPPPPPAGRAATAPDPGPAPALLAAVADQLLAKLAQAGPAGRRALERLDEQALHELAHDLLASQPDPGPAQAQGP